MTIGTDLRRDREAKGATREQIAQLAGLSVSTIVKAERGTDSRYSTVEKIRDAIARAPQKSPRKAATARGVDRRGKGG